MPRTATLLALLVVAATANAAPPDPMARLNALTDQMAFVARHEQSLAINQGALPPRSEIIGVETTNPYVIPGRRILKTVEFTDGFKTHIVHDAVDAKGNRKLIVVGQETERDWIIVADEKVSPAPGTIFTGTNMAESKLPTQCALNKNPGAIVFGYLTPTTEGWQANGTTTIAYTLDPKSQLIPLTEFPVTCTSQPRQKESPPAKRLSKNAS